MIRSLRLLLAAALIALPPGLAMAQSTLLQGGSWATGRLPMYVGQTGGQTIVQDSGPASGGGPGIGISEFNVTARGTGTAPYVAQGTGPNGEVGCFFDAPSTNSTGYHSLCFSANVASGGLLSYQANGAASALPFRMKINGTSYEFPFNIGGIVGPATTVIGDAACWNSTNGAVLADCGAFVTVGGNNTWTGTNDFTSTFKIGGVTQTFPTSGLLVGTTDTQTLTNKSIAASQINSGTLPGAVMPALTGDVTSTVNTVATTIANGAVTNAKIAAMTQNAVKGASVSTAVADLAMPSCSGGADALQWLSGTGFQCAALGASSAGWGINLSGGGVLSISTAAPPFGMDSPINMGLTASVGANALTINLRTAAGSAPSATDPVLIPFRSTTAATGTVTWRAITGALSIVVPSGATLGTSNNIAFRVWLFATYNSGTPQLGVAVCSTSTTQAPCSMWEGTRKTTIAIDALSASAGVLYATGAVSNDAVRIIGYAEYSSGLATAGSYVSVPTILQVFGAGVNKPGDIVQRLYSRTTTQGSTASGSLVALTSGQSVSFTLSASPNVVKLNWSGTAGAPNGSIGQLRVYRNATTAIGSVIGMNHATSGANQFPVAQEIFDFPGTVSAITYDMFGATGSGTINYPLTGTGAQMVIEEIMGAFPEPANDNINPGVYSATG